MEIIDWDYDDYLDIKYNRKWLSDEADQFKNHLQQSRKHHRVIIFITPEK